MGRVLRTEFLLKYLGSAERRSIVQAATKKSEAYNLEQTLNEEKQTDQKLTQLAKGGINTRAQQSAAR